MDSSTYSPLKVTIALPTYGRPEGLARALASVAMQDYQNMEVIVLDNGGLDQSAEQVAMDFSNRFPEFRYINHGENVGPFRNFRLGLDLAQGDYFMWLADDDELQGQRYLSTLVDVLNSDPMTVTACAPWRCMISEDQVENICSQSLDGNRVIVRLMKFLRNEIDNSFYGLHRTQLASNAFEAVEFWKISGSGLDRSAYPFVFSMLLQGKIHIIASSNLEGIAWCSHSYSDKFYETIYGTTALEEIHLKHRLAARLKLLFRIINLKFKYFKLLIRFRGPISAIPGLPFLVFSIFLEIWRFVGRRVSPI